MEKITRYKTCLTKQLQCEKNDSLGSGFLLWKETFRNAKLSLVQYQEKNSRNSCDIRLHSLSFIQNNHCQFQIGTGHFS